MLTFFMVVLLASAAAAAVSFVVLKRVDRRSLLVGVLVSAVVSVLGASIVSCVNTHDTEVWNGVVTGKERNAVSCTHSYPCNCRTECTGSGKNQSCSTRCDTCYEHFWDYDWDVYTSNGETITIDRVDRQGIYEPPRFATVKVGEPTAVEHSYVNYVKAAPGSLFRRQGSMDAYKDKIPKYPGRVYDYYNIDRFVHVDVSVKDAASWNSGLMHANAEIGKRKQVNMVVVLVDEVPPDWYFALEESWLGGKKNDVVLVVSVDRSMHPRWARVMAWTTDELVKVGLRDEVMSMERIEHGPVIDAMKKHVSMHYARKPMKDFEYLSSQMTPSTLEWVLTLVVSMILAVGTMLLLDAKLSNSRYRRRFWHEKNTRKKR